MAKLKCIVESPRANDPAIIFIHGLDGHGSQTWMFDKSDEKTLWPKWLADDFDCSVFLVAYDAALSRWIDSAMPLPDQGDSVLEMLSSEPKLKDRPLILVGHSMGGLVIKTAIHHGLTKGVERYENIVNQIRGVVFVGTPHKGSQLATLATLFSPVLRTNTQVKNMQKHDPHLRSLNQQFLAYYSKQPAGKVSVLTFAETQGVLLGKNLWKLRLGKTVTIVDPDSSEPHVPGEIAVRLPADHISICKLSDKDEPLYKSLLRFLREEVDLTLVSVAPETVDPEHNDPASDDSKVDPRSPEKSQPAITAGNISAGNGGVAAANISGSVTINNK